MSTSSRQPSPDTHRPVPSPKNRSELYGILSLVLASSSCVGGLCCSPLTNVLGLVGIAMGLLGAQQARETSHRVLGVVGAALCALMMVVSFVAPMDWMLLDGLFSVLEWNLERK